MHDPAVATIHGVFPRFVEVLGALLLPYMCVQKADGADNK